MILLPAQSGDSSGAGGQDFDKLTCDAEGKLWLRLPDGEKAGFTPAAQVQLEPWLEERDGIVGLEIEGRFSPIAGAGAA